jgi:hypothetical protein
MSFWFDGMLGVWGTISWRISAFSTFPGGTCAIMNFWFDGLLDGAEATFSRRISAFSILALTG